MRTQRLTFTIGLVGICGGAVGCSSTFQLYVANETPRAYALRINDSDHAYPLQPSAKNELPDCLERGRAYTLHALDGEGHQHQYKIVATSARLFVHLRENSSGVLEWFVSETPLADE